MNRIFTLLALAAILGVNALANQQQSSAVEALIKQGIMEEARGTNSFTNVLNAVKGTFLKGYSGRLGEGFKLYVKFESPLSEKEVASQLKQGASWVEADGLRYDTNAPHYPGACFVPDQKDARKNFREFVVTTVGKCQRYYSISGSGRRWITLYVEEGENGKRTYHLFHGFTYD